MIRFCLFFVAAITLTAADPVQTFTGVITDTMCGMKPHSAMMKDKTSEECVKACARGPWAYALNDGTNVMKLSDQKMPAKYAAKRVKITGTFDEKTKTIKVVAIDPLNEN